MIRLLLLIPTLDRSGAEKQLTLLASRLPRDSFDVRVVALTRGGPYETELAENNVPVTILGKRAKFDPFAYRKLRRILKTWQPHILHTWLFAANAYGRLAVKPSSEIKTIVSERCVDSWKSRWQHWLDRRLIPRTTRLVGNSESVAAFYREKGYSAEQVVSISNGIEIPALTHTARDALRKEWDLPANARVVGYIGRLAKQKRVQDLIWASEVLRHLDERTYFVIAGDGPERAALESFTRDVECADHVRFLGHRDDATQLLQAFDVFWLASDFEGQSNSIMEAMAAGLPVVASDIAPNRELVVEGETGRLVPVGDRTAFAKAVRDLFADEQHARKVGEAGRQRVEEYFSVEKMVDQYVRLYRELTEENTSSLISPAI